MVTNPSGVQEGQVNWEIVPEESDSDTKAQDKKSRQRSQYLFPAYPFGVALDIADRIENKGAGSLSEEALAVDMDLSVKSSGFKVKTLTARQFGLVNKRGEILETTPLAKAILKPTNETDKSDGLRQAFLKMPLFQVVADRYKGIPFPQGQILRNILEREFKIDNARVRDAERLLLDSARDTGVLTTKGEKMYLVVSGIPTPQEQPDTSTSKDESPNDTNKPENGDNDQKPNSTPQDSGLMEVRKAYANLLLDKVTEQKDLSSQGDILDRLERVLGIASTQSGN